MAERIVKLNAATEHASNQNCISIEAAQDTEDKNSIKQLHLHEALDFYQLFDTLMSELKQLVSCDSIEFKDENTQSCLLNGTSGRHSCQYALKHEDRLLGDILITRNSQFSHEELEQIESMLAGLVQPLRNALRYQQVIRFAQRDELTGLRNSSYYHDIVELEILRAQRYKKPFSLLMFDLDDFESINQQYSQDGGDTVLVEVARRIEKKARDSDVVYRNGGDKFLVFLPYTNKTEATKAAKRIKSFVLEDSCKYKDHDIAFTLSAGIVTVSYDDTASKLMTKVNDALLQAKKSGKNRIHGDLSEGIGMAGQV